MKVKLEKKAIAYLVETLGIVGDFTPYPEAANLPVHLTESHLIKEFRILGGRFLALIQGDQEHTPASIEKQADWLLQKTGLRCIVVVEALAAYNRKRLIERHIPFLVPGIQLYLPDLGVDLREHFKKAHTKVLKLSPASQVVVLAYLLRRLRSGDELRANSLAEELGYTKMTMARALAELGALHLVEHEGEARSGRFRFAATGQQLWELARPYLRSPVKKRIYLDEWTQGSEFKAGEAALAEKTMLGSGVRGTWAVTSRQWQQLQKEAGAHMRLEVSKAMANAQFELWNYAPHLLAEPPCVDPLSLALSLDDESDERVQLEVDALMKALPW